MAAAKRENGRRKTGAGRQNGKAAAAEREDGCGETGDGYRKAGFGRGKTVKKNKNPLDG